MLKYIIRLDDACEKLNINNWDRVEQILSKYNIKPIVGIIPSCKDLSFEKYDYENDFWENRVCRWKEKGWIFAQHGLHHELTSDIRTEYSGVPFTLQYNNLVEGNQILRNNDVCPTCFFAPAHSFDDNTITAISKLGFFEFISDGYSLFPYTYKGVKFLPNLFDTPHTFLPFGIYTFVYHPNTMNDYNFIYLEKF